MENEAFYATAAQVLPILYAILFVETRYFGARRGSWSPLRPGEEMSMFWSVVSVGYMLIFAAAELAALAALMGGEVAGRTDNLIYIAFALLLTAVTVVPTAPQLALLWNRSPLGRVIHLADLRTKSDDD